MGLALISMASLPSPAWGQWNGCSAGIYYSGGSVGIGTSSPIEPFQVHVGSGLNVGIYNSIYPGIGSYTDNFSSWGSFQVHNNMYILSNGYVGIGTTTPQFLLSVNGQIGAKDVIVTNSGWPDYVFQPDYRLRPLSEVNAYIQANRHLPDIPTEAEVKEKGVSVSDMQSKLLAKIEELTLFMIQQDKENRELRERVAQLEAQRPGSGAPMAGPVR